MGGEKIVFFIRQPTLVETSMHYHHSCHQHLRNFHSCLLNTFMTMSTSIFNLTFHTPPHNS
jgi:hypothetical protein